LALGALDVHLTASPDVTFFRHRVQQHTNFQMEPVLQQFNTPVSFGSDVMAQVNRTGDLVHYIYVVIDLPAIKAAVVPSGDTAFRQRFPSVTDVCDPCADGPQPQECGTGTHFTAQAPDTGIPIGGQNFDDGVAPGFDPVNPETFFDTCTGLTGAWCNWVNEIGFAMITRASFTIGGQTIDTLYSHYLHMWEELTGKPGKRLEEMIGKRFTRAQLVEDSQSARTLYVPLPFYFARHSGNSLPLVSLQFHTVNVHLTFERLEKLIQVSAPNVNVVKCSDNQPINNNDICARLELTYIHLDIEERDRFATGSFQQLITQVQCYITNTRNLLINAQLNFNHPCINLMWAVQRKCHADANYTFNYAGKYGKDPIGMANLKLNNQDRFSREATYFRLVQPYQHFTDIPQSFVYSYSFALNPESENPSGSLNFSRIDNVEFNVQLIDTGVEEVNTLNSCCCY
jgi:hypothetical protein